MTALVTTEADAFRAALPPEGALLGIDLGTKTLGLALTDPVRTVATPHEVYARGKFKADSARLGDLAASRDVAGIVIGLPFNMDGSSGSRVQATRAYARNLSEKLRLPILLWDERLSTVAAERTLIAADASRARRRDVIDKLAATLILQTATDRLRAAPLDADSAD